MIKSVLLFNLMVKKKLSHDGKQLSFSILNPTREESSSQNDFSIKTSSIYGN